MYICIGARGCRPTVLFTNSPGLLAGCRPTVLFTNSPGVAAAAAADADDICNTDLLVAIPMASEMAPFSITTTTSTTTSTSTATIAEAELDAQAVLVAEGESKSGTDLC